MWNTSQPGKGPGDGDGDGVGGTGEGVGVGGGVGGDGGTGVGGDGVGVLPLLKHQGRLEGFGSTGTQQHPRSSQPPWSTPEKPQSVRSDI